MEACVKCAKGTYQAEPGQLNCTKCPAGSFCGEGATAPSRLVRVGVKVRVSLTPTLTLTLTLTITLTSCPGGYYSSNEGQSNGTAACQKCEPGTYPKGVLILRGLGGTYLKGVSPG